ncbi:MAG: hypothetical protein QM532_01475 [Cyanobium sp. MAG06]|nr:hypothetical protein [Cyanobium sp. MAG06]
MLALVAVRLVKNPETEVKIFENQVVDVPLLEIISCKEELPFINNLKGLGLYGAVEEPNEKLPLYPYSQLPIFN